MKHTGWIMILSAELPWSLQELDDYLFLIFMNNHNEVCLLTITTTLALAKYRSEVSGQLIIRFIL